MSDPLPPDAALRERADRIVLEALDAEPGARDALVAERCVGNEPLRRLVESLLAEAHRLDEFLVEPIVEPSMAAARFVDFGSQDARDDDLIDRRIGSWRIVREIGRGGMGLVYEVERDDGVVRQRAALKLIRRGMDSEAIVARFRIERQILAALDHPHIARLIDGGATDDGRPYLVMERVEGVPLDQWCAARALSIEERLALFVVICGAVQYAHQRLVVHRDLKPSNILVTADGQPKLLDFGVAKLLDPESRDDATLDANRLLTPRYASPEQLNGVPVSTASDVYALGVLLYELVTGRAPYRVVTTSVIEMLRAINEQEPMRPSLAVTQPVTGPAPTSDATVPLASDAVEREGRRLAQRLRGDIDHIVLKALAKEPSQRYGSAAELRDDLARHLAGEPIRATVPTWRYRARKFVGRNRAAVAAASFAVVALIAGTGVATWQAVRADRQRDLAEARFQDTRKLARSMLFEINDELSSGPTAAREKLVRTALEYLDRLSSERLEPDLQRDVASGYERIADIVGNPGMNNLGRPQEAEQYLQRALVLRKRLLDAHPHNPVDLKGMYNVNGRLGELFRFKGPAEEAARYFAEGARYARERVALTPDDPDAVVNLYSMRRYDAAIRYAPGRPHLHQFDEARKRFVALVDDYDRYLATHPSTRNLDLVYGIVLAELTDLYRIGGESQKALDTARRALAVRERMFAKAPEDSVVLRDIGGNERRVGNALIALGRFDEGIGWILRAQARNEAVARADPSNTRGQRDMGIAYATAGEAYLRQGLAREALAALLSWQAKVDEGIAREPKNGAWKLDRIEVLQRLAEVRIVSGEPAVALAEAREADGAIVAKSGATPADEPSREMLARVRLVEAKALKEAGRVAEAWPIARSGVGLFEENVRVDPGDLVAVREAAVASFEAGRIGLGGIAADRSEACRLLRSAEERLRDLAANDRLNAQFAHFVPEAEAAVKGCGG